MYVSIENMNVKVSDHASLSQEELDEINSLLDI